MPGGIAEEAIGKSAPWLILSVMLFSLCVRMVYIESSSMFVRGGVYRVVKEAMGSTLAKISVSALIFDFILTAPISGVSAGQYLVALLNEIFRLSGYPIHIPRGSGSAFFAILIILYFWRKNLIGIEESSSKAMQIMKVATVMVVLMIGWGIVTLLVRGGFGLPPAPSESSFKFSKKALGWLDGTSLPTIPLIMIMIGFGHSILALERGRDAGPGLPGDRSPETSESEESRHCDFRFQRHLHAGCFLPGRRPDPGCRSTRTTTTT